MIARNDCLVNEKAPCDCAQGAFLIVIANKAQYVGQ